MTLVAEGVLSRPSMRQRGDTVVGPTPDQLNLVVRDMHASVAFYRRLGLDIPDTLPEWQAHHRSVRTADGLDFDLDSIEFARVWNRGFVPSSGGGNVVMTFRVESRDAVDAIWADVTGAGYPGQQDPYDAFWGARFAIVTDPDGNAVGIMSPSDDAHRGAEPEPPF
jgi:predicted lactoylglutathione lyase